MNNEERDKPSLGSVKKVQQNLYSNNTEIKEYNRHGFSSQHLPDQGTHTWQEFDHVEQSIPEKSQVSKKQPMTVFMKLLIISFLFFIFSGAGAFLVYSLGQNEVSYSNVDIAILGPHSIGGGEELRLDVQVTNNNSVDIIKTDITISYPRGTLTTVEDPDEQNLPLDQDIKSIEGMIPGTTESKTFKSIVFGKEGDVLEIPVVFQYRVPGSNNLFSQERSYKIRIDSTPLFLQTEHETRYQNGGEVEIMITAGSNAAQIIKDVVLEIEYPFGFEFVSSIPESLIPDRFIVGDLEPQAEKIYFITGTIAGQTNDQRTIRYQLGTHRAREPETTESVLAITESTIEISRPPINLVLATNETDGSLHIAQPGEVIDFELVYSNDTDTTLQNQIISVYLSGDGYNQQQVNPGDGYYQSTENRISWNSADIIELDSIEPDMHGVVTFSLQVPEISELAGRHKNPEIVIRSIAEATLFDIDNEEKLVSNSIDNKVKIISTANITTNLTHSDASITEKISPDQVGTIVNHTLVAQATNTVNPVTNAQVSFVLPPYVVLGKQTEAVAAQISYDKRTRMVIWSPGNIAAGSGYDQDATEVSIILDFEPSLNQVGTSPVLVGEATFTAFDTFADKKINATASSVQTNRSVLISPN